MLLNISGTEAGVQQDTTANVVENIGETIGELADMPVRDILGFLAENAMSIGLKVLAAIIIYAVGAWLIQRIKRLLKKITVH